MQFRLTYQGKLHAQSGSNSQVKEKHEIRRVLHKQMVRLWEGHPFLSKHLDELKEGVKYVESEDELHTFMEDPTLAVIADQYARFGYKFIPLVGESFGASACALDILFLRRDHPGNLVKSGGDIDNRIKVLFDALRMPNTFAEVFEQPPGSDETPFFCLLEDDRLITEVKVTTDRLLASSGESENEHDVHLIIHVRTLVSGSDGLAAFLA